MSAVKRIVRILIIAFFGIYSLQANQWLVKSIVLNDGAVWFKYILSYDSHRQITRVRTWTSPDRVEWQYTGSSVFAYNGSNRLVSRLDYDIISDNDSVLVSKKTVEYPPSAFSLTSHYDFASNTVFSETRGFPAADSTVCSGRWTTLDGVEKARQVAVYHHRNDVLEAVDYICIAGTDTLMNYRCLFSNPSPTEQRTTLQVYKNNRWADSLCTRTFGADNGNIKSVVQYGVSDTVRVPQLKAEYAYSSDNSVQSVVFQTRNGSRWTPLLRKLNSRTDGVLTDVSFQNYSNREWQSLVTSSVAHNDLGQVEAVSNSREFWSESDLDAIRYAELPENLKNRYAKATEMSFVYITGEPTPADTIDDLTQLVVFPNPSPSGIFRIDATVAADTRYEVYSTAGERVAAGYIAGGVINLSHLDSGVYIVAIYSANSKLVTKLIK